MTSVWGYGERLCSKIIQKDEILLKRIILLLDNAWGKGKTRIEEFAEV